MTENRIASAAAGILPPRHLERPPSNANSGLHSPQIRTVDQAHSSKGPFLLMSGFEAANDSPGRGYLYGFRNNDTRRALPAFSDAEARRRIQWLCANFGMARRMYLGPAKLLGFQTPHPTTPNDDWNDAAFENFQARAGQPHIYDVKGRDDFFTGQLTMNRCRFRDGRILKGFTNTRSGGARTATYEAHQIKNGPNDSEHGKYQDGVHLDRHDRHLGWRVQDGKNPEKFQRVDARDGHYFGNYDSPGPVHGTSILMHAVMNMHDVVELRGMRKHAAKNSAQLGLAVEKDRAMAVVTGAASGLGGPLMTAEIELPDGTKQEVQWEQMTGQGMVPHLNPGEKIRIVTDDRPSPNNLEFDNVLIDDCIHGIDLPAAALRWVAGMGGPAVRFVMEEIRRWITLQHRYQAQYNARYYAVHMAKEVAAGRLPEIEGPYWRQCEWIGLPDMTIDRGREAAATVTRLDTGLTTWSREYARDGLFARKELRRRIREVAQVKQDIIAAEEEFEVPIAWSEVFRNWSPAGASAATEEPPDSAESEEEEADQAEEEEEATNQA